MPTAAESTAITNAITAALAFQNAFRGQDFEAHAAALNYPHVRLAKGRFETYATPEEFIASRVEGENALKAEAWHHTVTRSITVVQGSVDKVHLAMAVTRCHEDGTPYNHFDSLWIVTLVEGHWGVQFRSSFLRT